VLKARQGSVLAVKKFYDQGFQIGGLNVSLRINPAIPAKIIDHEINAMIVAIRHDRRPWSGSRTKTPANGSQ
jgi:hypothetical protein